MEEIRKIPKIELHAHLNGSVRYEHLRAIVESEADLPPHPTPGVSDMKDYFAFMAAVSKLTGTKKKLSYVLNEVLKDFEKDGVVYLELRSSPKNTGDMTKEEYIGTILEVFECYTGLMIVRYLVSIDQSKSLDEMIENAYLAVKYCNNSPSVVGVDLCGDVFKADRDNSIKALSICKQAGLKIVCHIAEEHIISSHTPYLLKQIQPDRLGHGTLISPGSPEGQIVKHHNMLIECCITSNLLSKTVTSAKEHHFKRWYDQGHPVLLCTDDAGTFHTSLSREYQIAMESWGFNSNDLLKMNHDAVYAIFDDSVKGKLQRKFLNLVHKS